MRKRQSGAAGLFIAVLLILVIGGILATLAFLQTRGQGDKSGQDTQRMEKVKAALVQFVATNSRLPCPANPTANPETGLENRTALSATCNSPTGTVPWATIGLGRNDAIDAWGWKISYRVYTGTAGSLTQDGGANMVDCDTTELVSRGTTTVSGSAGGLCRSTLDTLPAEFLAAAKGLSITWFGAAITRVAYVLVSHGPSGYGAYTATVPASMKTAPVAGSAEASNTAAAGPFVAKEWNTAGLALDDANHFDDVLAYQTIADVVRLAGRGARDWPEVALADVRLDRATLQTALGSTISGTNTNLGQSTLYISGARVTGLVSGSAAELSYYSETGGIDGIGGAAGSGRLNASQNEGVRLEFNQTASRLGLTLNNFGIVTAGGQTYVEQAQLVFYDAAGAVVDTINVSACRSELGSGRLASFSVSPAASFSRVDISPRTVTGSGGGSRSTSFIMSEFIACNSTTCLTSLYDAVNNSCP